MIKYAPEDISAMGSGNSHLNSLRNCHTQSSPTLRIGGKCLSTILGYRGGRGMNGRIVHSHYGRPVWLCFIAVLYHKHIKIEPEMLTGNTHCRAPLTCTCLGSKVFNPLHGIIIGLRDCSIEFM